MRKFYPYIGLVMVCIGVIVFLVSYIARWTHTNLPLFVGLAFVVAGAVIHVVWQKKSSEY